MKILLVATVYTPTISGVTTHIRSLKKDLEEMGHEVWVLAPKNKNQKTKEKNIIRITSFKNPMDSEYPIPIGIFCPRELKKIKFDIVHLHQPYGLTQITKRIQKKSKAKLLFTSHTQYETYANYYIPILGRALRPLIRFALKRLFKKCDQVICSTGDISNYVKKIYPKVKTAIIPVGFDERSLKPFYKKGHTRFLHGLKEDNFYILYAGRIAEEKNIKLLINAVKKISAKNKKAKLLVVGGGDYLKKIYAEKNDSIIFCGPMPASKLASYYQDCDLFASASTSETLGLVFAEASFMGAPLLGIDSPGIRDIIKNKTNGILAKNEDEFIQKLKEISCGKINTTNFKKNAKKYSLAFSASQNSKKLEELYQEPTKKSFALKYLSGYNQG